MGSNPRGVKARRAGMEVGSSREERGWRRRSPERSDDRYVCNITHDTDISTVFLTAYSYCTSTASAISPRVANRQSYTAPSVFPMTAPGRSIHTDLIPDFRAG